MDAPYAVSWKCCINFENFFKEITSLQLELTVKPKPVSLPVLSLIKVLSKRPGMV